MTESSETPRKQLRGEAMRSLLPMVKYTSHNVPEDYRHLVSLRASVLNDCRACTATHRRDARTDGWSEERILKAERWTNNSDAFGEDEQLVLSLTDAITHIDGDESVPNDLWDAAVDKLGEEETLNLLVSIVAINSFNRVSIATRTDPKRIEGTTEFDLSRD
nr:Argininosuccinate synthase [Streptococcus thermophilus]